MAPPAAEANHGQQGAARCAAFSTRTLSFHLLAIFPVILLLSLHTFLDPARPARFALGLLCLFVFLGVALQRATVDLIEILRDYLRESRLSFQETLGENEFVEQLSQRSRTQRGGE